MENNKRGLKNILLVLVMLLSIGAMVFTGYLANKNIEVEIAASNETKSNENMMGEPPGEPPSMNENNNTSDNTSGDTSTDKETTDNSEKSSSMNSDAMEGNGNTPPEKPEGDNGGTSPEKPDGENSNSSSETTDGQSGAVAPNQTTTTTTNTKVELTTPYIIAFGVEGAIFALSLMYLILSKGNKKTFVETFIDVDKIVICLLSTVLIVAGVIYGSGKIMEPILEDNVVTKTDNTNNNNNNNNNSNTPPGQPGNNSSSSTSKGKETVTEEKTLNGTYETSEVDESPILVQNGGNATIDGATINKTGGDSSSTESSEFTGVNAGVLVEKGSTATIKNSKITTNAKGSNAVFSTGENSKIYISDTEINTTGTGSARGLDATYGGYIEADNVTIVTKGGSCATLATDRGEGTVKVKNSKLTTNGAGSPVIYSTGDISIENTIGLANGSQMVVIEGKNSATVTDSTLTASGIGNRNNVDKAGVMIYQSMSGDASVGKGTFTATHSSLTIDKSSQVYLTAPMFFVTNTTAEINLNNSKLSYGSNILLSVVATSEWGKSGSNGGDVVLNATEQSLSGDINVDNISTLEMNLTRSLYSGVINKENVAKSIKLKLDKDSQITLKGDSYITSLENEDTTNSNIDFNGYKLYVNGAAIN